MSGFSFVLSFISVSRGSVRGAVVYPSWLLDPEGGVFERRRRAGGDRSRFGEADLEGDLVGVQCEQRRSR